jgi:hypothetical protein
LPWRLAGIAAGLALLPGAARAAEDPWALPPAEPPVRLGLGIGADADDGSSLEADATLPLPGYWELFLLAAEYDDPGAEAPFESWTVGLGSDPLADWVFRVETSGAGEAKALETRDTRVTLTRYRGAWDVSGHLQAGTVELFLREALARRPRFDGRAEVDREAYGAGVGYRRGGLRGFVEYTDFAYEQDVSQLSGRGARIVFRPETLARAAALPAWESAVGVSGPGPGFDWLAALLASESALDGERLDQLTLEAAWPVGASADMTGRLDLPLDDQPEAVTLGVDWRF